ncbi:MAG: hypothetical protein IIA59_05110 [Candidatus Marinimicrobia bacterium]|nr:hypothetical protein [Candidatus Neomarinimicrobiota bacterium]
MNDISEEKKIISEEKKIRITADFHPDAYAVLNRVADMLHTSKADALRRALGLIDYILTIQSNGSELIIEEKGGKRTVIKTF